MSLLPIVGPDGLPDLTALWQRAYLLRLLSADDTAGLNRTIDRYCNGWAGFLHNETAKWEPTWIHYVTEGKNVEVVIQGTENVRQALLHLGGVIDIEAVGGQYVNRTWHLVAQSLLESLRATVSAPGIERVTLCGHSYGGGVAELLADDLAELLPDEVIVDVVTFGAPRARTARWLDGQADHSVRVAARDDVVPLMPPRNMVVRPEGVAAIVTLKDGVKIPWSHTGRKVSLLPGGGAALGGFDEEDSLGAWSGNLDVWTAAHPIYRYEQRLWEIPGVQTVASAAPAGPVEKAKIDASPPASLVIENVGDDLVRAWNEAYYGASTAPISASVVDAFGSVASEVTQADLLPPVNIGFFPGGSVAIVSGFTRVTMCINNGVYGRQESHVVNIGVDQTANLKTAINQLCTRRALLLGCAQAAGTAPVKSRGTPQIEFVKITDAFLPKAGQVLEVSLNGYFGAQGTDAQSADFLATGLSLNLRGTLNAQDGGATTGAQPAQRSTLLLTGQPDDVVKAGIFVANFIQADGSQLYGNIVRYLQFLGAAVREDGSQSIYKWGFLGLRNDEPKKVITVIAPVGGEWLLTVPAHGFDTHDRVRLTGMSKTWNGQYSIVVVSADTLKLNKAPAQGQTVGKLGQLQRVGLKNGKRQLAFYKYDGVDRDLEGRPVVKVRKKNPGREFLNVTFQSRTRRPR